MEKAGGKGVYPARAFDFHRFLKERKRKKQKQKNKNIVRLPFSVPFVFRCRYGSPEKKAVHRLPPGKSSSVCQELAKFIELVE